MPKARGLAPSLAGREPEEASQGAAQGMQRSTAPSALGLRPQEALDLAESDLFNRLHTGRQ